MSRLFVGLIPAVIVLVIATVAWPTTIDTFPLPVEPYSVHYARDVMQIGPEGDVWLTLPMPQRLMRISGDELRCVLDSGIMAKWPNYLTISPEGEFWIDFFECTFTPDAGLRESDVEIPPQHADSISSFFIFGPPLIGADCRMYLHGNATYMQKQWRASIWEVASGQSPLMLFDVYSLDWPFLVSASEFWAYVSTYKGDSGEAWEIDLDQGLVKAEYDEGCALINTKDSEERFWCIGLTEIYTFDRYERSVYYAIDNRLRFGWPLALTADWTIWVGAFGRDSSPRGVFRIQGDEEQLFTMDDGLLTNACWRPKIDYDGRVWFFNANDEGIIGLSRITDGGWPPMRLMLHRVETEGTIAVEAQVINNGPVVGVDVYVAIELNGQLLFWPTWQPEPYANQINLRPGHNQTATIIESRKEDIPPGAYTFWGCMTGRNTSKLIGPIDRKFETITIEVTDAK